MAVQHARLIFTAFFLLVILQWEQFWRRRFFTPIDSLIIKLICHWSLKNSSRFRREDYGDMMNKDQITNPFEAIRGHVPGLTIQRGHKWSGSLGCSTLEGNHLLFSGNDPLITSTSIGDSEYAHLHLPLRILRASPLPWKTLPKPHNNVHEELPRCDRGHH